MHTHRRSSAKDIHTLTHIQKHIHTRTLTGAVVQRMRASTMMCRVQGALGGRIAAAAIRIVSVASQGNECLWKFK
jgi:hypothetical protein